MRRTYWLLSLALLALGGTAQANDDSYTFIPLSTLGGAMSLGSDVNKHGKAVGHSLNSSAIWRGFEFQDGVMGDLGTLGGTFSMASRINMHGHKTGAANTTGNTETHAVVWTEFGVTDLGTISGYKSAQGLAINKFGEVVGEANLRPIGGFALPNSQAFYVGNAGMVAIPTLGGRYSRANHLSDKGEIVGVAEVANSANVHAVQWERKKKDTWRITDLGTLPGFPSSAANAVSNAGWIVGWSFNSTFSQASAFLHKGGIWQGAMIPLPGLGGNVSLASGINKHHLIVGMSSTPLGDRHAVKWDPYGNITDLNVYLPAGSGWVLTNAASINKHGDIIGSAVDPSGNTRAFILQKHGPRDDDGDD